MDNQRTALIIALVANVAAAIFWLVRPATDILAELALAGAWVLAGVIFIRYARRLYALGTASDPLRYSGIFLLLAGLIVAGRAVLLLIG
jgi:hypothetical protein